jgi:anthranilate synthase component 2
MILVIDNYDSFTYNLVQMLQTAHLETQRGPAIKAPEVEVVRNDHEPVAALLARRPAGIVLSPGPCRPEQAGVCIELLQAQTESEEPIPVLGVCLGHQALGIAFGARVERSPRLMHGKTSEVRHGGLGPFEGLPDPFTATRYHSLEVPEESLSEDLEPLAWSDDGSLMGMRHRRLPYWGVQFHPESILTTTGPELLANFLRFCADEQA